MWLRTFALSLAIAVFGAQPGFGQSLTRLSYGVFDGYDQYSSLHLYAYADDFDIPGDDTDFNSDIAFGNSNYTYGTLTSVAAAQDGATAGGEAQCEVYSRLLVSGSDTLAEVSTEFNLNYGYAGVGGTSVWGNADFQWGRGATPGDTEELVTGLSVNKLEVGSGSTSLVAKLKLEWTDYGYGVPKAPKLVRIRRLNHINPKINYLWIDGGSVESLYDDVDSNWGNGFSDPQTRIVDGHVVYYMEMQVPLPCNVGDEWELLAADFQPTTSWSPGNNVALEPDDASEQPGGVIAGYGETWAKATAQLEVQ